MGNVPSAGEPLDLIDLKLLPAWVKEDWSPPRPAEWDEDHERWPGGGERRHDRPPRPSRPEKKNRDRRDRRPAHDRARPDRRDRKHPRDSQAPRQSPAALPELEVHFLPQTAAFENVAAQIKAGTVAYSVYALARLFLQKPERYHVRIRRKDTRPFFQLRDS